MRITEDTTLEQLAVMVSRKQDVDMASARTWSESERKLREYELFVRVLKTRGRN